MKSHGMNKIAASVPGEGERPSRAVLKQLPGVLREIAKLCGVDTALKVTKMYGGSRVYIPKLTGQHRQLRNQAIREKHNAGHMSANQLAKRYGISERQVFYILGSSGEKGSRGLNGATASKGLKASPPDGHSTIRRQGNGRGAGQVERGEKASENVS